MHFASKSYIGVIFGMYVIMKAVDKKIKYQSIRIILVAIVFFMGLAFQTKGNTVTGSGNWDNTGIWSGANIADNVSENVSMGNNLSITVRNTFSYTVGNVTTGNNNTVTIANGGTLNVGASGNPKNFTSNNDATLYVYGTLIIWGDMDVNNKLTLVVTGTLIIKGNLNIKNEGNLSISGNVTVDGDFIGGNNTDLTVDGNLTVGGDLKVGNNSAIDGSGTVTVSGSCTDGNSSFCGTGPLPVSLLFFSASNVEGQMVLTWATASELNLDYFSIERSLDGSYFTEIARVKGNGNTTERQDYSYNDIEPIGQKLYYRLKSVDFDGYQEHFNVVMVDFEVEKKVNIYPNPVTNGQVTVSLNFVPGAGVVVITDLMGATVYKATWSNEASKQVFPIMLQTGTYLIRFVSEDYQHTSRILVK